MEQLKSQPFRIYENESALVCHFDFMRLSLKLHLHFPQLNCGRCGNAFTFSRVESTRTNDQGFALESVTVGLCIRVGMYVY